MATEAIQPKFFKICHLRQCYIVITWITVKDSVSDVDLVHSQLQIETKPVKSTEVFKPINEVIKL